MAAAAMVDGAGRVLLSLRHAHLHQGGLWEFPGGKLGPGETAREALARELHEELGIRVRHARPLIRVAHDYQDRSVILDVWRVERWDGTPHGREGQQVEWVSPAQLSQRAFPPADLPVITACVLPDRYLVTPEPGPDRAVFLGRLEQALTAGVRLVQLRARELPEDALRALAVEALVRCRAHSARLLVNGPPALAHEVGADGVHLTAARLASLATRPLPPPLLVGASCHDAGELARAEALGADFAVLGPVAATASHPDRPPLGWSRFESLVEACNLPVYALGGMQAAHRARAWAGGGQGIAAITGLWPMV